jgi:hypothetical protein
MLVRVSLLLLLSTWCGPSLAQDARLDEAIKAERRAVHDAINLAQEPLRRFRAPKPAGLRVKGPQRRDRI